MKLVWATRRWGVGLLLLAAGGCTRLLDHSAVRCNVDDDCSGYSEYHPYCRQHVCVASGLAPKNCFFATEGNPPMNEEDFLNGCSTGFLPSSNSSQVEECLSDTRDPGSFDAGLRMPPPRAAPPANKMTPPTVFCKDLVPDGKPTIYMSGSSNFQPLLAELAPAIADTVGIVPVFRITTSCIGAHSMNPDSPTYQSDHYIKDPVLPSEAYAQIFPGGGQGGVNCLLGTTGIPVDVGESEIYPESCEGPTNSDKTVAESLGPILPLMFIVPSRSNEMAISFETAHQVFGTGGNVSPWLDSTRLFVRGNGTATLRLLAKELELTPTQVWGVDQGSAVAMAENVGVTAEPGAVQSTIGIIGIDFYDIYRGSLKPLAFQAKGQKCAYVPDSKLSTRDRINVRDGHYPLWGRIHFYTQVFEGNPVSPTAQNFAFRLTNPNLDPEIFEAYVNAGFVPTCAMNVTRSGELSPLLVNNPLPHACGCAFDKLTSLKKIAPEGCQPCLDNGDCKAPTPYCNFKFCEKTL